jgi:hypothetical protein
VGRNLFVQVAVRVEAVRQKPGARLHAALVDWLLRRERHGLASARLVMHRRADSLRRCEVRWHRKIVGVKGWIKWAPLSRARRLRRRLRHAAHVDVVSLIMKPYGTPRGDRWGDFPMSQANGLVQGIFAAEALQNTLRQNSLPPGLGGATPGDTILHTHALNSQQTQPPPRPRRHKHIQPPTPSLQAIVFYFGTSLPQNKGGQGGVGTRSSSSKHPQPPQQQQRVPRETR